MWKSVKRYLVGNPISTEQAQHERLNNKTALAVFSSDPLSSVAVYVEINPQNTVELKKQWETWDEGIPLEVLASPFRSVTAPLFKFIYDESETRKNSITTVVLPEFVPRAWWQQLLHNQTTLLIKGKLLFSRNIVVTSVPHHLRR